MSTLSFRDKLILVTGASSGLGRHLAQRFALHEGAHLVVAARRLERLHELKDEIESQCQSRVTPVEVDLSAPEAPRYLIERAEQAGELFAVVNNAGVTRWGPTEAFSWEDYAVLFRINALAPIEIIHTLLPRFLARGSGAFLSITSEAALFPLPYQNAYAASKHAIHVFTEALATEVRGSGVYVTAFAPGGIRTEMVEKSGLVAKFPMHSPVLMDPDVVAAQAIRALKRRRVSAIPGLANRIQASILKMLPRPVRRAIIAGFYKPR